ncbi:MAG TPA: aspartyl protease family protein [Steroidobacteraceae bacterium]|jgi:tetratricopeptide (TPR) repeat protein|nr:aspartyl protease family protein [Steroidobacteraceae bacterium]
MRSTMTRSLPALGSVVLALMLSATRPAQAVTCRLERLPDIPVTMQGLLPTVHAQINGVDALFVADSGALVQFVTPAAVREFKLRVDNSLQGQIQGVGGVERAQVAWAKSFTIAGMTVADVPFVVAGSGFGGAVGLLGQNLFRVADVEYDLANGVIRLVRPKDCKESSLAYWAAEANKPYSVIDIALADARQPHTKSVAYLNGTKIEVLFDTGSPVSILTLAAARHAGMTPGSPGVVEGGSASGIGHKVTMTWIARFPSFKLGDEEIDHAKLRFGDISLLGADMLIGADFFLSHRIYVASSQRKLYFTYNGGPVFDLAAMRAPGGAGETGAAPAAPVAAEPKADIDARLDRPTDAAGYARRGAASAARHDYDAAIADLTRACELAPAQPDYFYQRGMAHWGRKRADLALADFDQAIRLKPDDTDALLARASLRASRGDAPEVIAADLDAADPALPKEADAHLRLGHLYDDAGQPAAAVVQYTKWIDSHPQEDVRMAGALNSRCWARALTGQALDLALADCNAALRMRPNTAAFLDSRGLVYLRQKNYDRAIADYDAALHLQPKSAWSLYGRGLAKQHKAMMADAQADIGSATALQPKIATTAAKYGIT